MASTDIHSKPGPHGHPGLTLQTTDGAEADLILNGGHLLRWKPAGTEHEPLYLSPQSEYGEGKAVRGGVPVIFPQFNTLGPLSKHGFARIRPWNLVAAMPEEGIATLRLDDTDDVAAVWGQPFSLELSIALSGHSLALRLCVDHRGTDAAFEFTGALHTYFKVRDIEQARLEGLMGCRYLDATLDRSVFTEAAHEVHFGPEIDRVYTGAPAELTLHAGDYNLKIEQTGFPDTVVWNPGETKGRQLADLPQDGWRHFVCVESAIAETPVRLEPGQRWIGTQTLVLVS